MTATASVLICRGCCCGKDEPVQAARHEEALRRAVADLPRGRVTLTKCLGPCSARDIVAVRHRDTDRPGTPLGTTWLRRVDDAAVESLRCWIVGGATGDVPRALAGHVFDPDDNDVTPDDRITVSDRVNTPVRRIRRIRPQRGRALADSIAATIGTGGTWTLGAHGAVAEFDTSQHPVTVNVVGEDDVAVVLARTEGGAMRIPVDQATRAFTYTETDDPAGVRDLTLLVRTEVARGRFDDGGIRVLGPDDAALVPTESGATLVDLGLGRRDMRLAVRTSDAALLRLVARHEGTPLAEIATEVFDALVSASPTRVLDAALGRIEVSAPIPPPDGQSPLGCHTHVRPDDIGQGPDRPAGLEVPIGWPTGPLHRPAPGGD